STLCFYSYLCPRDLHSFPTRRSSDLAGSIGSLTWWRFVAGAGSSMYMVGALVYLTDISSASNRARLIGLNQRALLFGQSIGPGLDRKSTRLNSSHVKISYAVFCLKKK